MSDDCFDEISLWQCCGASGEPGADLLLIRAEVSCTEDMSVNSLRDLVFLIAAESLLAWLRAILRVMVRNHWQDAITGCYAAVDSFWVCGRVCQGATDSPHRIA